MTTSHNASATSLILTRLAQVQASLERVEAQGMALQSRLARVETRLCKFMELMDCVEAFKETDHA